MIFKRFVAVLLSMSFSLMSLTGFADESVDSIPTYDIRHDFISDVEDCSQTAWWVSSIGANDGNLEIVTKDAVQMTTSGTWLGVNLPSVDLGTKTYYMYVKARCDAPSGSVWNTARCVAYSDADRKVVATISNVDVSSTKDDYVCLKISLSSVTGNVYPTLQFSFKSTGTAAVSGSAAMYIDWILFSECSALGESTAMIDKFCASEISQDGSMTKIVVNENLFDTLTVGEFEELPDGLEAELSNGVNNVKQRVKITDVQNGKVVDVICSGMKNDSVVTRSYRLLVSKKPSASYDIRYDFISGDDGCNLTAWFIDSLESNGGILTLKTKSALEISTTGTYLNMNLPKVDFGDGGYDVYLKARCESPDGTVWTESRFVTCSDAELKTDTTICGSATVDSGHDFKIIKLSASGSSSVKSCKGELYPFIQFLLKSTGSDSIKGSVKIDIDWIVLSKNSSLDEINATIKMGDAETTLAAQGDVTDVEVESSVFEQIVECEETELPDYLECSVGNGFSDEEWSVSVVEEAGYKLMNVAVVAKKDGEWKTCCYKVRVMPIRYPVEPESDIRFDFISDDEKVVNTATSVISEIGAENGELILTSVSIELAKKQMHFELPKVDLKDGGYYMYVKVKYNLPSGAKLGSVFYGISEKAKQPYCDSIGETVSGEWSDYKIHRFKLNSETGEKFIRLYLQLSSDSTVTGVATAYIDWIVFSRNAVLDDSTSILSQISIDGVDYELPQNGDCAEIDLRTGLYDEIDANKNEIPNSWSISLGGRTDYDIKTGASGEFKIVDIITSDVEHCRTYRIMCRLKELDMKTTSGTMVTIPGAINIKGSEGAYSCELYPELYDLLTENDVIMSSETTGETIEIKRENGVLKVLSKDSSGNDTFSLQCKKIYSESSSVEMTSVQYRDGKLKFIGKTSSGNADVKIAAFDWTGNNVLAMGTASSDEKGAFSGEFALPEDNDVSAVTWEMKIGAYALNNEYIKNITYYNDVALEEAVNKVKTYNDGNEIFTQTKDISLFASLGVWTPDNDEDVAEVNSLLKKQITGIIPENIAEIVNGTVLAVKTKNQEDTVNLICKYDNETKGLVVSETHFNAISESGRKTIIEHILKNNSTETYETWSDFENALKKSMLFYILNAEEEYKNVDEIILNHTDIILYPETRTEGTVLEKLENASSDYADAVMKTLVNGQGATLFATSSELLNDLEIAFNNTVMNPDGASVNSNSGKNQNSPAAGTSFAVGGGNAGTVTTPVTIEYIDLDGYNWAKEAINYLSDEKIVSGVGGNKFEPARNVTREEFVKMICGAFGFASVDVDASFDDVPKDAWYAEYITAAVNAGVIKGLSKYLFGTGQLITRQDMATILNRAMKAKGVLLDETPLQFSDTNEVSDYAVGSVSALSNAGVINGIGDNFFAPKKASTRAEAAVMIYRSIMLFQ